MVDTTDKFKSINQRILLNLGCGQTRPLGWINTDSSLNSFAQKFSLIGYLFKGYIKSKIYYSANADYMDLRKPWRFGSNSVDVVYSSHVLEHLNLLCSSLFMRETYRVLKPGGVVRVVVPDLYQLSKKYVLAYELEQEAASEEFLYALNLHKEGTYSSAKNSLIKLLDLLQGYPHQHKYMYDKLSLKKIILSAGFVNVLESAYGESAYIPEIQQVEYTNEGVPSIYLEGKKPLNSKAR